MQEPSREPLAWQCVCDSHRLCATKATPTLPHSTRMGPPIQTQKSHGRGAILEGQGRTPSAHACRSGQHSQLDGDHDYSWITASHHQSDLRFGLSAIDLGGEGGPPSPSTRKQPIGWPPAPTRLRRKPTTLDQTPGSEYLHNHASDDTTLSS